MLGNIITNMMKKFLFPKVLKYENDLYNLKNSIRGTDTSTMRFEIIEEAMKSGQMPKGSIRTKFLQFGSLAGIFEGYKSIRDNPVLSKEIASKEELKKIEQIIMKCGVKHFSYTKLLAEMIFQNKAVLYDNVIVLLMEMDKKRIAMAPSVQTGEAVHEIYRNLGYSANDIVVGIRKLGFAAQAGHPLLGSSYYPPIAQKAGLGWIGKHGLLITPWYGPRFRIATVYTSIKNLPFFEGENSHKWIEDFCRTCGRCIEKCPMSAILKEKKDNPSGNSTYIDREKCFPYFIKTSGCSVCIKECTFNNNEYKKIKTNFLK